VAELSARAMELDGVSRSEYLDEHCGRGTPLRTAVEASVDESLAATLNEESSKPGTAWEMQEARKTAELIGRTIDGFVVVRVIGAGGMGCVFEARQDSPRRSVALKIMKVGMASPWAMRRFELESQLLGRLRHRGIAQVYDSGIYDDGGGAMPWFAMEYIPAARTLTAFAEHKHLSLRDRLILIGEVCGAVHHGHQKGIIHRDLKPDNILVDTSGQPKIIDFGVARSTDSDLSSATLATSAGQLLGTLQYMSPEQCEADPNDIDTRSDVYALGVILYELVCGVRPYNLSKTSLLEATRIISEVTPPSPRTRSHRLPRDVSTIVVKAMEKDRDRRYASAQALGEDIRRYLEHEPIVARPQRLVYQGRMFCRRHPTLTSLSVLAILVAAVGVPIVVRSQANAQVAEARRVAAEAMAVAAQNRRIEEVNQLVGLAALIEEDIRHVPGTEPSRRALLTRIIERLATLAAESDRDPLVLAQLAMAWERLASVPLPAMDAAALDHRFAAWDRAIELRSELDDRLTLTGTRYSMAGDAVHLAATPDLPPAQRLQAARRARAAFQWCRDEGDYTLLAGDPAPYRELINEEIAACDATIDRIHAAIRQAPDGS